MRRRTTAQAPASVLLVTLDTLRADRVGAWGGPPGLTPVLDALAARGLVFEEALASVPLTLPSHATLFTGLEPPRHGVHDNGTYVLPADVETLATRLKAAGYETGAFVGAYVLDRRFGLARGFDHYDDRIARNERGPSVLESERRGGDVVDAAAAWLARAAPAASSPGSTSTTRTRPTTRRLPTARPTRDVPTTARSPTWTRAWAA